MSVWQHVLGGIGVICSLCVSVAAHSEWDSRCDLQPVCQCGSMYWVG